LRCHRSLLGERLRDQGGKIRLPQR